MFVVAFILEDSMWQSLWQWAAEHGDVLTWLFVGSLASLVLCALLLPIIVLRLPADYFAPDRLATKPPRTLLTWLWRIGKNAFGVLFVLAGIAMLVLPGQGLLTLLIGMMLLDFPGKRSLERRIVSRPTIFKLLNKMRAKRLLPPLRVE